MAVKTITVTEDAYDTMKRLKKGDESFSDLFLRIGNKPLTCKDIEGILGPSNDGGNALRDRILKYRKESGSFFSTFNLDQ